MRQCCYKAEGGVKGNAFSALANKTRGQTWRRAEREEGNTQERPLGGVSCSGGLLQAVPLDASLREAGHALA
jgi:hypothetical protein